ncbi:hypothetical protein [Streptosporangium sp. V21-05]|uniref:hypothetical protein n=1 Tax=Streptosporangium sp. V21-05 TaxID=3446115 RepID=UPI003F533643
MSVFDRFRRRERVTAVFPVVQEDPAPARSLHYEGDLYRMPDWARRRDEERDLGHGHAREGGRVDAVMFRTGRVPRLRELEDARDAELHGIDDHGGEELRRADAERGSHAIALEESGARLAAAREELQHIDGELRELATPSRRPGDRRASAVAISGGRWAGVKRWLPAAVLLALLLIVEVPIFYQVILSWGDSPELTALLAAGTALVMLLAPHMYGRAFRAWQENERPSVGRWLLIGVACGWLALIVSVAVLRRDALVNPSGVGPLGENVGGWPTMILLLALLIATAVLAADLGRRMHNPNDARLKDLRAQRARLAAEYERAQLAHRRNVGYDTSLLRYIADAPHRRTSRIQQVDTGFRSLEKAYLDGVAEGLGNPEATSWIDVILENRARQRVPDAGLQ